VTASHLRNSVTNVSKDGRKWVGIEGVKGSASDRFTGTSKQPNMSRNQTGDQLKREGRGDCGQHNS